jgi:hypothetical protein
MQFKTVQDIQDAISAGDDIRRVRSANRAVVNNAANGVPPMSDDEALKNGLHVNVNWLEQSELHLQARSQFLTGFYHSQRFFTINFADDSNVPLDKQAKWEAWITRKINKVLRKSKAYFFLHDNRFASVVAHGIGPCAWFDRMKWCPKYVAIEDLYVPTDTTTDFENLEWFAIRFNYTEGELARRAFGPNRIKGWKKKRVAAVLKEYHEENTETVPTYNWNTDPEKMWELIKQNGFYTSDAVPTIPMLHFWFKDNDANGKTVWKMRVIPDSSCKGGDIQEFLYDPSTDDNEKKINGDEKPFARCLDHILHCQFGNLSNKAPFTYNAVRSLGFLLLEPCYWSNLMLCRLVQHTWEQFNTWLRITDPAGKGRAQLVNLFDKGVIPDGVTIVPKDQRHQIEPELAEMVMARMKQLMGEKAAQYTQQADTGTKKEQTAFETSVKMQQVNAMTAAILTRAFILENFLYEEICRRFCLVDSNDPDVMDFQKEAKKYGIPQQFLNVELWDVAPEIPSGAGNPTLEMAKNQMLMQYRSLYPPPAQQEILQRFTIQNTDPRTAERWVPLGKPAVTDAQTDAENKFGTLMQGVPVNAKPEFSPIEQVEVLLVLMGKKCDDIEKTGNITDENTLLGLTTVSAFTKQLVGRVAQDPQEKQLARKFSDVLGQIDNLIKGFTQRLAEQKKQQNSHADPKAIAQAQATMLQAKTKQKVTAVGAAQKMMQKKAAFAAEQKRKDAATALEERRKTIRTIGDEKRKNLSTIAETQRSRIKALREGGSE